MGIRNLKCYLCKGENINIIRKRLRYDVKRNVIKCEDCGIVYLEKKDVSLDEYYKDDYRNIYSPNLGQKLTSQEIFDACLPFQSYRQERINKLVSKHSIILDIGCSAGHFLYSMKDKVKTGIGIEFNRSDSEFVQDKLGIKVYSVPIEESDLPKKYFDVITLFHVLEHINNPIIFLNNIKKYLKDTGYICIEVPNINDALLSVYNIEKYADFWYREPHVFNFSIDSLKKLLDIVGIKGEFKTIQRYSIFNHMNWIASGAPQSVMAEGMSDYSIENSNQIDEIILSEFNLFFNKINSNYKDLLNKYNLGDSIFFIGQKDNN